ncbi:hypothetical protein [Paraglaciecola psychrophila]|uniref:hypothetical protein n=1 Tax=Paraglaciecola psychrophila TaxID=326544 RepID=UPI0013915165|nr:hypothetical protein [Paraglaciecola psychrophila]
MSSYAGLATTTDAFTAMITANFIGIIGHLYSLRRVETEVFDKCTLFKVFLLPAKQLFRNNYITMGVSLIAIVGVLGDNNAEP